MNAALDEGPAVEAARRALASQTPPAEGLLDDARGHFLRSGGAPS